MADGAGGPALSNNLVIGPQSFVDAKTSDVISASAEMPRQVRTLFAFESDRVLIWLRAHSLMVVFNSAHKSRVALVIGGGLAMD